MPVCSIYEVHYDATKTTAKETITIRDECMVEATSILDAEAKFSKHFPPKRGTAYEITAIIQYRKDVIK